MSQPKVTLVGVAGHVAGEELVLEYGKKVVVGRSRSADWSLVRMKSWAAKSQEERDKDDSFRTVSGKHFEVTMYNLGSVEVGNLSRNGTTLDGRPLERATLTDVAEKPHEVRFGADEVVRIEARAEAGPAAPAAEGAAAPEAPADGKSAEGPAPPPSPDAAADQGNADKS